MHKCNFLQFTYLLFAKEYAPKCNQKIEYANYIEADTVIYLIGHCTDTCQINCYLTITQPRSNRRYSILLNMQDYQNNVTSSKYL